MIKKSMIKYVCIDQKPKCWLAHQLNDKIKAKPVTTRVLEYGNTDGIPLVPSYLSNSSDHSSIGALILFTRKKFQSIKLIPSTSVD